MTYVVKVPLLDLAQWHAHINDYPQYGPPFLYFVGETPDIANPGPRLVPVLAASSKVSVVFIWTPKRAANLKGASLLYFQLSKIILYIVSSSP